MKLLDQIYKKALQHRQHPKKIVFTDGTSDRAIEAVRLVKKLKIADPILVGSKEAIEKKLVEHRLKDIPIIDPLTSIFRPKVIEEFVKLRKKKGMTRQKAEQIMRSAEYFGVMLVHLGFADGMVGGATATTADTVRPALQIISTKEHFHHVSGLFIMQLGERTLFFADCAVNVKPDAKTLSEIALDSAKTARAFGVEPKVALLSFSTLRSYEGKELEYIHKAVQLVKKKEPHLVVDGEMQVDAALVPDVARRKCPTSILKGDANVLIFPDLNAGNISYKLVERLAGARAIGPILQGLKKPISDLSRGCSVQDIVDLTAVTVVQTHDSS